MRRVFVARCRCGWAIEAEDVTDGRLKETMERMADLTRRHMLVSIGGPHLVQRTILEGGDDETTASVRRGAP